MGFRAFELEPGPAAAALPAVHDGDSARQAAYRQGGERLRHALVQAPQGDQDFDKGVGKKFRKTMKGNLV